MTNWDKTRATSIIRPMGITMMASLKRGINMKEDLARAMDMTRNAGWPMTTLTTVMTTATTIITRLPV
ncbi:MAG: hypothetical protein M1299_06975 [Firmicutes bacterium]|nr:hypothetical protein [Bacillota bacterium]MCL5039544.1 hypothetical protein [Bacillota bacterium]